MAVTRVVHVGDVHLQHGHQRNADRLASLDQIVVATALLDRLGAVLIPGDLFHQRSTVDDRNALAQRLQLLAMLAPVVLVRGNHDQPGDLDIFARLKANWPIYVVTRPQVLTVPLATGETAAIACLPYPDKFGLVSAGIAPGDVVPTAGELLDVIFMQLAHELEVLRVSGALPLFAGHANIRGAIASTGQPQIGMEIEIDRAMLERLPVVYCALNHIHKPQEVGAGVFAGSIAAMDHGETEPKSFVVVETTRQADGAWAATWTRQPIDTPPMDHIEGELTREGFVADTKQDRIDTAPCWSWAGRDVRVRYRYKASERAVIDERVIREIFKDALRLKIEAVAVPDRELRAPAVAAATTLPAKLAAYRQVETLEASLADKLTQLQQQDPVAVLADVARTLVAIEADNTPKGAVDATFDDTRSAAQPVLQVAS